MIDYWYTGDYSYKDIVVRYFPVVVHTLSTPSYRTLHLLEEPVEEIIAFAEEKKEEEKKPTAVLYFDFDSYRIRKEEGEKLKGLLKGKSYFLVGHACWIGKEDYNKRLSLKRAKAVEKRMKDMGFSISGIEARGEEDCKQKKNLWQCRKVEVFEDDR